MTQPTIPAIPAELSCLFLGGLEEILGREEVQSLLQTPDLYPAAPRDVDIFQKPMSKGDLNLILSSVNTRYGALGSKGLFLRVGRVFFKDFYRIHYQELGLLDLNYRMLPKPERIKVGLEKIATVFEKFYPGGALVDENENTYFWKFDCLSGYYGNETNRIALTYFFLGIFQEFLAWVTGGKYFHPVREVNGIDPISLKCVIEVDKHFIS
jgi:hypothetical protein